MGQKMPKLIVFVFIVGTFNVLQGIQWWMEKICSSNGSRDASESRDMKFNFFTVMVAKSPRSDPSAMTISLDQLIRNTTSSTTIWLVNNSGAGFKKDDFFKGKKIVPKNPILVKYCHPIGKFLDDFYLK